jgi:hypothetical protein
LASSTLPCNSGLKKKTGFSRKKNKNLSIYTPNTIDTSKISMPKMLRNPDEPIIRKTHEIEMGNKKFDINHE